MAASRYRVRRGIVIRRTPLPSGDVVATLLSGDGKWRAVARKGRMLGGNPGRLSLFHDVTVQSYARRDDDLAVATQVRLNGALSRLADPAIYPFAHVLAELADRLTVDVHLGEPLHGWLASGLRGLDGDDDPERVALVHAWMLLRVAGLAPDLAAADEGEGSPRLDVASGRVARSGEGTVLTPALLAGLRLLVTARAREALADPLPDRAGHWRILERYVSWHVDDLRSLRGAAGAAVTAPRSAPGSEGA